MTALEGPAAGGDEAVVQGLASAQERLDRLQATVEAYDGVLSLRAAVGELGASWLGSPDPVLQAAGQRLRELIAEPEKACDLVAEWRAAGVL